MNLNKNCNNCKFDSYVCLNDYKNNLENTSDDMLMIDFVLKSIRNCKNCFCKSNKAVDGYCNNGNALDCQNWQEK